MTSHNIDKAQIKKLIVKKALRDNRVLSALKTYIAQQGSRSAVAEVPAWQLAGIGGDPHTSAVSIQMKSQKGHYDSGSVGLTPNVTVDGMHGQRDAQQLAQRLALSTVTNDWKDEGKLEENSRSEDMRQNSSDGFAQLNVDKL